MGLDIESFVCAFVVVVLSFLFRWFVCVVCESSSCVWLGWFFVLIAVVVALCMLRL